MRIQNHIPGKTPLPPEQAPAGYTWFVSRNGWIVEYGIPIPPRSHPLDGSTADDDALVAAGIPREGLSGD